MRRTGRHRRVKPAVALKMTSMMDILVVLLLFLVKSFVADEQMSPSAGVQLPESTAKEHPEDSVVIAITETSILVGEDWVADLSAVMASDEMRIEKLARELETIRAQKEDLARIQGVDVQLGLVTIQGDREIEFAVLQRVMYTVGAEGWDEISLAVIRTT
ncbi:MAG: biopolymer transporter ExbD [Candidatus Eisenbacteria bacterium]|uniref:Biopolymer transporter ExbD n=1 Tax=Eiseniibacteriota bacterium TaxID=2212470 RepID=A0A956NE94_UNCEI|nr:biopolymer transporter ExbD [Candidatus Eisenbacteria bacterium]MCB9466119.1 biopolymer transporter ExbD [Candidatus Eisenbacteria bacterium]